MSESWTSGLGALDTSHLRTDASLNYPPYKGAGGSTLQSHTQLEKTFSSSHYFGLLKFLSPGIFHHLNTWK